MGSLPNANIPSRERKYPIIGCCSADTVYHIYIFIYKPGKPDFPLFCSQLLGGGEARGDVKSSCEKGPRFRAVERGRRGWRMRR
jgi:hypothetical protein